MKGEGEIPLDMSVLSSNTLITDIVYVPLETPFLKAARLAGLRTVDGLGMLLHQARPGFEKWFGVLPDVTPELRQLIIADMDRRT
jgi:shikimate dehydrogenase